MNQMQGIQTQIPKFTEQNYYHWRIQIKVLFESQELWGVIQEGIRELGTNPTDEATTAYRDAVKKDKRALHILFQSVGDTIFERIALAKSSKEAWSILHKCYQGENRVKSIKLQSLRCEFDALNMKEGESVEDYFNRIILVVNKLRMNEETVSEQRIVEKILRSLTRILNESVKKEVRTGDDKRLEVLGCGEVSLKIKEQVWKIPSVFYVKGSKHNLLSIGQLLQKGYAVHFKKDRCIIKDVNDETIGNIKMTSNKMFPLRPSSDVNFAMTMTTKETTALWHKRYGHVNVDTLVSMGNKGSVLGLPKIVKDESVCEGCVSGKQARKAFSKKVTWQATKPLELVHFDICGPMRTKSIGGCKYFITFIDDYSRKAWVFFLKFKSEALYFF
uniref:Putative ribonuclease H-like domain, GAG-pre-integrase domain protein n=1 Tax=Helianthus annuus TaxID=4232 RepID=A0A251RQH2_HELAN